MARARQVLATALRQAGLTVTGEQLGLVTAERGGRFSGLTLAPEKVPLAVIADLEPDGAGCVVVLRIEDRWKLPLGRNWGAISVYRGVFEGLAGELDRALGGLGPTGDPGPWVHDLGEDVAAMRGAADVAAKFNKAIGRQTDRILEGAPQQAGTSTASGVTSLELVTEAAVVSLDASVIDAMLTTGRLVVDRPGGMPAPLVADVQRFVLGVEEQLEAHVRHGPVTGVVRVPIEKSDVPVVAFLYQQSRLREHVPLRLLMQCTTCRLEKVVNPDLVRLRERARRGHALTGSLGMVISGRGGISPYVMLGRLAHLKKSEPDFVCPRCQGLDADECVVTFCPQCGERRDEAVLRSCRRCDFDFRGLDPAKPGWAPIAAPTTDPALTADGVPGPHQHPHAPPAQQAAPDGCAHPPPPPPTAGR